MNKKKRYDIANQVIDVAKINGADEVSVIISENKQSSIEIRNGKVDLLEGAEEANIALALYVNNRYSVNQTSVLEKNSLNEFIKNAIFLTQQINYDEYRMLPDTNLYWNGKGKNLFINDKKFPNVKPEIKKNIVLELEEKTRNKSNKIVSVTSGYSDSYSEFLKINSNGFIGEKISTGFSIGSEVVVKDKNGALPSDWYYSYTRYFDDMPDLDIIADISTKMAEKKIGQKKIISGKYDMVVANRASSKLIGLILSSITGSKLWNKNTFLEGMLNKKVFSDKLTIIDEPHLKKGLGSKYFDGDGFETKKYKIIENGMLNRYLINDYFSRKLKLSPTTGGTSNIHLENGNKNLIEIIKSVSKGIFVTGFLGGNFNSTTGDFSFGINGLLIENGEQTIPVNEMNITGNVIELFNNIIEIGNDSYVYSSYMTPSLLFENISFSGL